MNDYQCSHIYTHNTCIIDVKIEQKQVVCAATAKPTIVLMVFMYVYIQE